MRHSEPRRWRSAIAADHAGDRSDTAAPVPLVRHRAGPARPPGPAARWPSGRPWRRPSRAAPPPPPAVSAPRPGRSSGRSGARRRGRGRAAAWPGSGSRPTCRRRSAGRRRRHDRRGFRSPPRPAARGNPHGPRPAPASPGRRPKTAQLASARAERSGSSRRAWRPCTSFVPGREGVVGGWWLVGARVRFVPCFRRRGGSRHQSPVTNHP